MPPTYEDQHCSAAFVYNAVVSYMRNRGRPAPQYDILVSLHSKALKMTLSEADRDLRVHLQKDLDALSPVVKSKNGGDSGEPVLER